MPPRLAPPAEITARGALQRAEIRLIGQYLCDPLDVEVATDRGDLALKLDDETVQGPLAALKSDAIEPNNIWELQIRHARQRRQDR